MHSPKGGGTVTAYHLVQGINFAALVSFNQIGRVPMLRNVLRKNSWAVVITLAAFAAGQIKRHNLNALFASAGLVLALSAPVPATADDDFETECEGAQEVPAVFTEAECEFEAEIDDDVIEFELSYKDLKGDVQQAHIHFAQEGVNGTIVVFLCTNLDNTPAGAQVRPCPAAPATVTGTIEPADVTPTSTAQGFPAGDLEALVEAMDDGLTYVNVHTANAGGVPSNFNAGEVRGQLE